MTDGLLALPHLCTYLKKKKEQKGKKQKKHHLRRTFARKSRWSAIAVENAMGEIHHRSLSGPIKTLTGAQEGLSGVDILPANSMGGHFAGQTFGGGGGWGEKDGC